MLIVSPYVYLIMAPKKLIHTNTKHIQYSSKNREIEVKSALHPCIFFFVLFGDLNWTELILFILFPAFWTQLQFLDFGYVLYWALVLKLVLQQFNRVSCWCPHSNTKIIGRLKANLQMRNRHKSKWQFGLQFLAKK